MTTQDPRTQKMNDNAESSSPELSQPRVEVDVRPDVHPGAAAARLHLLADKKKLMERLAANARQLFGSDALTCERAPS